MIVRMVDFKKLMNTCMKVLNPDENDLRNWKHCHLPKNHDGECKE